MSDNICYRDAYARSGEATVTGYESKGRINKRLRIKPVRAQGDVLPEA